MSNFPKSIRGVLVLLSLMAAPVQSKDLCCKIINTGFGRISVERRDVPLATTMGNHIERVARNVLRLTAVHFVIVDGAHHKYHWGDTSPDGLAVYPWRFVHGTDYLATQPPNSILPHEVGHDILRRSLIPSIRSKQYGTDAPDWLDESVAIAFEMPEDQAQRRCEASSLLKSDSLLTVRRYLTMDHPDLQSLQSNRSPASGFGFSSTASKNTPSFYALSIAFPEYLAERTHSVSILREIVDAYLQGNALNPWILARLGIPDTIDGMNILQHDFIVWIRSSRSYKCV